MALGFVLPESDNGMGQIAGGVPDGVYGSGM